MSMIVDQWAERVFSALPGNPPPSRRDDIYQVQFDMLAALGEMISNTPLRALLSKDFQVPCVGGICDLSAVTLVGGAALSTANVFSLVVDTIKRHKVLHPDSLEPCQPERGNTIHVDHPKREMTFGYLYYTLAQNALYIRNESGTAPSDQPVVFKSSFSPTFPFFVGTSPSLQELEQHAVVIGVRLVGALPAQSAA